MKKNVVDIKSGLLFPLHFRFFSVLALIGACVLLRESVTLATLLALASLFVLSASEGTVVDSHAKRYSEYTSMYFIFRKNDWKMFHEIEKIFIKQSSKSRRITTAHTAQSSQFLYTEYDAWLKFDDGTKVHLFSKKNKVQVGNRTKEIAAKLAVPVEDFTS
jgi:hypothetical protein